MKVIYEFDEREERNERALFELSSRMYLSLCEIDEYLRNLRKGYCCDSIDRILETISESIYESNIRELE